MFESLTERLGQAFRQLTGKSHLKEQHLKETLKEVREALLEADVALPVVKDFVHRVQEKALGHEIMQHLSPTQQFIQIVHDELVHIMGDSNVDINLKVSPPAIILMAGLQGAGKTTAVAKLAYWLKEKHHKKIGVVSTDIYRPAAIEQLNTGRLLLH